MSAMVLEQKKQEPSGTGMIIDDNHEGNWQYSFTKMCVSYEPIVPPCKHSYIHLPEMCKNVHHSIVYNNEIWK